MAIDNFRRVDFTLDKANGYIPSDQFAKENDNNGRELTVQITDGGVIKDQSSLVLTLAWKHDTAGNEGQTLFTRLNGSQGIFTVAYDNAMMIPGIVTACIQIVEGERVTNTRNFKLRIENNPLNVDKAVAEDSFKVFVEALAGLTKYDGRIASIESELAPARGGYANLNAREDTQDNAIVKAQSTANSKFDSNQAEAYLKSITALPETFANLAAIKAKYPSGKNGLMVAADNGHKYIWSNGTWTDAGEYQATGIAPNSVATEAIKQSAVTIKKIDGLTINSVHSINQFDSNNAIIGAMNANGFVKSEQWVHTNYIMVSPGAVVHINKAYNNYLCTYDKFGNFVKAYETSINGNAAEVALDDNVKFIIVNCFVDYLNDFMVTINDPMPVSYQPFTGATDSAEINWLHLKDNSISLEKLNGTKIVKRRSANRYNEQSTVDGKMATIDGIINYDNRRRTDYLNVTPGDLITLSKVAGGNSIAAVGYDLSKHPVKSWVYQYDHGKTSLIIPNNVFFIIINVFKDWPNFMFSINEPLPDAYEPYVKNDVVDAAWISRSKFENKSAMIFGDSIVWYDGHSQPDGTIAIGYPTLLKEFLGFNEVANLGISGAPIARGKTTDNGSGNCIETKYEPCDLVIIEGGTNDFKLDVELGVINKVGAVFDKATTTGALQSAIESIFKSKPDQLITLMTPLQRNNSGYDIYNKNNAGYTLNDYREEILEIGRLYSIPVWDGYSSSGINMLNLDALTLDGLHLNNVGYRFVTERLTSFLRGV